jgi:hypothetical protein
MNGSPSSRISKNLRRRVETITGYTRPSDIIPPSKRTDDPTSRIHHDDYLAERFPFEYLHPIKIHQTCAIVAAHSSSMNVIKASLTTPLPTTSPPLLSSTTSSSLDPSFLSSLPAPTFDPLLGKSSDTSNTSSEERGGGEGGEGGEGIVPSLIELAMRDPHLSSSPTGLIGVDRKEDGRTYIVPSVCITSSAIGNVDYCLTCDDHIWLSPLASDIQRVPKYRHTFMQPSGTKEMNHSIVDDDHLLSSSLSISLTISILCHYGRARAALWQLVREQPTLMRFIGGPRGILVDIVGDAKDIQFDARHWSFPSSPLLLRPKPYPNHRL